MRLVIFILSTLMSGFSLAGDITVNEKQNSQRIVSTNASVTELIFALNKQDQLVAVDVTTRLPKEFSHLQNIGYHRMLSAEGILSLQPGIVIGSDHMGPEPALEVLEKSSVKVLKLKTAENIEQFQQNITTVAEQLNAQHAAGQLIKELQTHHKTLLQHQLKNKKIAFLLTMDPSKLRLAGKGTSGDIFIRLLGGQNVVDYQNYQNVTAESLFALNPDILIIAGREQQKAVNEFLQANPIINKTSAVKNQSIVAVNSSALIAGISVAAVSEADRIAQQFSR